MTGTADVPGVQCVIVLHDSHCPGAHGDGARCICDPEIKLVSASEFERTFYAPENRAARRAAAKAARTGKQGKQR